MHRLLIASFVLLATSCGLSHDYRPEGLNHGPVRKSNVSGGALPNTHLVILEMDENAQEVAFFTEQ